MGIFRRNKDTRDLAALADERRVTEDETPWFLADDDGPELRVETGIGSNLRDELDDPPAPRRRRD